MLRFMPAILLAVILYVPGLSVAAWADTESTLRALGVITEEIGRHLEREAIADEQRALEEEQRQRADEVRQEAARAREKSIHDAELDRNIVLHQKKVVQLQRASQLMHERMLARWQEQ